MKVEVRRRDLSTCHEGPVQQFVMAEGELRNVCNEDVTVMRGSYDYYGPVGVKYTVDWYADETGKYFHNIDLFSRVIKYKK